MNKLDNVIEYCKEQELIEINNNGEIKMTEKGNKYVAIFLHEKNEMHFLVFTHTLEYLKKHGWRKNE